MTDENSSTSNKPQSFPDATAETAAMFNIDSSKAVPIESQHAAPHNLPVIDAVSTPVKAEETYKEAAKYTEPVFDPTDLAAPRDLDTAEPIEENPDSGKAKVLRVAKTAVPYIGIFLVGLFLYQYFFSGFSVAQFLKNDQSKIVASQSETNERLEALKKEKATAYDAWIRQFFYEVSDPSIVDMDNDLSGNGLTNFEKFLLNLNPKAYDTLGLGQPDGQTVMDGTNPWTGKPLSDNQRKIVELYFDRQIISNRLAAGSLKLSQGGIATNDSAPGSDGYQNPGNYSFIDGTGANPAGSFGSSNSSNSTQVAGAAIGQSTSGQGSGLNTLDVNTDIPGHLDIPANKISAPLIFTKDAANFEKDLTQGVVHYPGTALPGATGTAYISGHSSGYAWQKNPYKNIFRGLGGVKDGTSFTISVTLRDGRKATLNYVVQSRQEFAANDQAQFVQTAEPRVALSTCWPVDTSRSRLVLFAKQTQISF